MNAIAGSADQRAIQFNRGRPEFLQQNAEQNEVVNENTKDQILPDEPRVSGDNNESSKKETKGEK